MRTNSNPPSSGSCCVRSDSFVHSKWFAIALLVSSLVISGILAAMGVAGLFNPHIGSFVYNGSLAPFIVACTLGLVAIIVSSIVTAKAFRKKSTVVQQSTNPIGAATQRTSQTTTVTQPVDTKTVDINPIIQAAAKEDHTVAITVLKAKRASIHEKDELGKTLLHWASLFGNLETVNALLDQGAQINTLDDFGQTPLHLAAIRGHTQVVKALLARGADPKIKCQDGSLPLHFGCHRDVELIRALATVSDINSRDNNGATPLHQAVLQNNAAAVNVLIELGAHIEAKNKQDETPLFSTVHVFPLPNKNKTETLQALIQHGAQIEVTDKRGLTPLMKCCEINCVDTTELVEVLLNAGASISARTPAGQSALDLAKFSGNQKIVSLLRAKGAK